jgi:3-oxoacyl-[acyl-carrier-protein] synthase-1
MTAVPDDVAIVGCGASTPIGRSAPATVAAARAGVCGFREHPFMIDSAGEPMRVAAVPWLPMEVEGAARFEDLLIPAVNESREPLAATTAVRGMRLGVALALPPDRPGLAADLARRLKEQLSQALGVRIALSETFQCGHAAGYLALALAHDALTGGTVDACIVAGVDSYLAPETLEWIESNDQLHGGGSQNNAWGFIPGEAAGALLLVRRSLAERLDLDVLGTIVRVGLGREEKLIKTDAVCIGEGLTAAFRAALAALPGDARIDDVVCDLNGEPYRADEYGFAVLRTKERFRAATDFVAPADCWGDVGAAGAPLHIAQCLAACRKGYARGPLSLAWGSSESGERGAAVVHAPLHTRG